MLYFLCLECNGLVWLEVFLDKFVKKKRYKMNLVLEYIMNLKFYEDEKIRFGCILVFCDYYLYFVII